MLKMQQELAILLIVLGGPSACPAGQAKDEPQDRLANDDKAALDDTSESDESAPAPEKPSKPRCPSGMTLVPGGEFPESVLPILDEHYNRSEAKVEDFCLGTTEVTAGDYIACAVAGACTERSLERMFPDDCDENVKWCNDLANQVLVRKISSEEARRYCEFRGGRLPTAKEWYWAALGGEEARPYPWGSEPLARDRLNVCDTSCRDAVIAEYCGYADDPPNCFDEIPERVPNPAYEIEDPHERLVGDHHPGLAPAGSYPAGAGRWGQLDLQGNASEWVVMRGAPAVCGTDSDSERVPKLDEEFPCRAANVEHDTGFGIRCAADYGPR